MGLFKKLETQIEITNVKTQSVISEDCVKDIIFGENLLEDFEMTNFLLEEKELTFEKSWEIALKSLKFLSNDALNEFFNELYSDDKERAEYWTKKSRKDKYSELRRLANTISKEDMKKITELPDVKTIASTNRKLITHPIGAGVAGSAAAGGGILSTILSVAFGLSAGFGGTATIAGITLTGKAVETAANICLGASLGCAGIVLGSLIGGTVHTVKLIKNRSKLNKEVATQLTKIIKEKAPKSLKETCDFFVECFTELLNEDATRETINAKNDALSNANDALADAKAQANDLKQKAQDEAQQKIEDAKAKVERAKNEVEIAKAQRREELAKTQVGAGPMTQQNASVEFIDSSKSILMELDMANTDPIAGSTNGPMKPSQPSKEEIKVQELEQELQRLINAAQRTAVAKHGHEAFQARTNAKIDEAKAKAAIRAAGNIDGIGTT